MGLAIQTSEFKMRRNDRQWQQSAQFMCDTNASVPGHFGAQNAHFLPESASLAAAV
jgi:hypothetical protein